jgi:energy-coupling factor transport system permease protein
MGSIIIHGLFCQALSSLAFCLKILKIYGEYMNNCFKRLHVSSSIVFNTMLLFITFSTDNPLFLIGVFTGCILVFYLSYNLKKLARGLIVFLPFFLVTMLINFLFIQQGSTILFSLGGRNFTLEALVYAVVLSSKLLLVIYIFQMLGIMVDSDKAVSFFSSIMPKSTLTLMIALKLFPLMKKRIDSLKEIYSIRGLDFEGKSIKYKLLAYKPVLSVLLEDSLEKSFDIGEAVFTRGFLSSKRTVYDRQSLNSYDWVLSVASIMIVMVYVAINMFGFYNGSIYSDKLNNYILNKGVHIVWILFVMLYGELIYINRKLVVKDELY